MNRPLLIGQAPGPNTDPELPLFPLPMTSSGARLAKMTGLSFYRYMALFDRVNLLNYFPGKSKKEDKFPMSPAMIAASAMTPLLVGRTVVLVGRNVADAFKLETDFHEWAILRCKRSEPITKCDGMARVVIIPHPSGRNHWYNKEGNQELSEKFWRDFVKNIL